MYVCVCVSRGINLSSIREDVRERTSIARQRNTSHRRAPAVALIGCRDYDYESITRVDMPSAWRYTHASYRAQFSERRRRENYKSAKF